MEDLAGAVAALGHAFQASEDTPLTPKEKAFAEYKKPADDRDMDFIRDQLSQKEQRASEYFYLRKQRLDARQNVENWGHTRIDLVHQKARGRVHKDYQTMDVENRVDFIALQGNLTDVTFTLHPDLTITALVDGEGRALRYWFDGGALRVFFAKPLNAGEMANLFLKTSGELVHDFYGRMAWVEGTGGSYGWLPLYGYLDLATTDLLIGVPPGNVTCGTGDLAAQFKEEGSSYYRWKMDLPIALAGIILGPYIEEKEPGKEVRTFSPDIPLEIRSYATSGYYSDVKKALNDTHVALELYSKLFAPYPFHAFAITELPSYWGYGQGLPSMLLLSPSAFLSRSLTDTFSFGGSGSGAFIAHEVSHQWWGHLVPWKTPHDQWLSESFAQISSAMYVQATTGGTEYKSFIDGWEQRGLRYAYDGSIWLGGPLLGKAYYPLTYLKGAYVLHMLRMMLPTAKDGNEVLFKTCLENLCKLAMSRPMEHRAVSTEDFQSICEQTIGPSNLMAWYGQPNLDFFFDQWIYGYGYPQYRLLYRLSMDGSKVEGKITQVQKSPKDPFWMPLHIYVHFKDGSGEVKQLINGDWEQKFTLEFPGKKVVKVVLDEFNHVFGTTESQRTSDPL